MPNWQPNWSDVIWNWGAASAASHELRRMADRLDESAQERRQLASAAQAEWRGRFRDEFDGDLAHMVGEAQNIAAELRAAAGQIDNASDRARAEQQHRERERERWRREKREEERREREARERRERERRKNS
ncbi:MAG: hypothetical protein M9936_02485 [Caldilinea sp.]|mgnify:CR=1 FL=1|nr:hypothetical protein [Caldilineaceae bacterium]MCO5208534.1 hypothetical protein [Caldilinea sp.]